MRWAIACTSAIAFASAAAATSTGREAATELPPEVEHAIQQAGLPREALAVVVHDVDAPEPRLAWRADVPVNPASLTKLVTTYAGLDLLGPAWSWKTPVWLLGPVKDGVLEGDLVIKGQGDPTLVLERVWLLLRRVQQAGVREIRGDIVLDRSAFEPAAGHAGDFDGEPLRPYNVAPDALLLNHKSVTLSVRPDLLRGIAVVRSEPPLAGFRVDPAVALADGPCADWRAALRADFSDPGYARLSGTYPRECGERHWPVAYVDPASFNARLLEGLWLEMGGRLHGVVREGPAPFRTADFEMVSPLLAEIVRDINKFSSNVMAQQLFLTLALVQRAEGRAEWAREVVREWLAGRLGDAGREAVIDNGSGLSRDTRMSAAALAQLLRQAWNGPVMPELLSSLPLVGLDGTLQRWLAPAGRAHLKTGSLRDVFGVAGVVLGDSGRRRVVVAIVNHPNAGQARPVLDALVQWAMRDAPLPGTGTPAR